MIDKLRNMAIFATVVDCGTFRAAAKHLRLAPSRVSKVVSDLERELGVTLLYRSTRQLSLTIEGDILYLKVKDMLQSAEIGLDAVNQMITKVSGDLRVTAPAFVLHTGMMSSFAEFSKLNSGIILKFNFTDYPKDLIKENFDVGIRAGPMEDSDLMSRSIGKSGRLLVASPDYVATKKTPTHPRDLKDWDWLHFSMRSENYDFVSKENEKASVSCKFRIEVDSVYALNEFAVRGLGVTRLTENFANRGISKGELVRVLPEWDCEPLELHAVWPDKSGRESLSLIFIRFLANQSKNI